eukprot:7272777-Pyramimonas_sp.AAC.1
MRSAPHGCEALPSDQTKRAQTPYTDWVGLQCDGNKQLCVGASRGGTALEPGPAHGLLASWYETPLVFRDPGDCYGG